MTEVQKNQKREKMEEKYIFFTPFNKRPKRTKFKPFEPSMVVPDRNMTISVIMSKYAGGQHRGLEPIYTSPDMMDMVQGIDARKLSISELHERISENKEKILRYQRNLQEQEKLKLQKAAEIAQKKYRDELAAEIQKELKEAPKMH